MSIIIKLTYLFVDLLFPLALGYGLRHRSWFSEKICDRLIKANIIYLCTVLSFFSSWVLPLKTELIWLPLFGILLSLIPGLAAYGLSRHKYQSGLETGSYLASAMLSNVGTLGGICVFVLFGEAAFAYTQIVAMFQNLVLFLVCFPMAHFYQRRENPHGPLEHLNLAGLFFSRNQLPVLGLLAGILLYSFDVPRPVFLDQIFTPLVHLSAWTALIPVGFSINFMAMRRYYGSILDLVPIKFIITPLVSLIIARHLFSDPVVLNTILVLASVPTGINAIVTARLYHLNLHVSGAAFVLTTAVFLTLIYPLLVFYIF